MFSKRELYDRADTIGRGQSLLRFARHVRGVVVHDGTLIVPTISDADAVRPEIVAPPSAVTENSPLSALGNSANLKSTPDSTPMRPITPANGIPAANTR
jgi:hypothetical protein